MKLFKVETLETTIGETTYMESTYFVLAENEDQAKQMVQHDGFEVPFENMTVTDITEPVFVDAYHRPHESVIQRSAL